MKTREKKLLIANRGEISCRVIHTAKAMGFITYSLHTSEEKELPHVKFSDHSFYLGESSDLKNTYLNQEKIIDICIKNNIHFIHPGYGFLSENPVFAKKVKEAGLIFVGPEHDIIELMGDKKASKAKMEELGIPLIKGYHGDNQDPQFLQNKAEEIGFPLLIKASAGGGGKGMRIVNTKEEFPRMLEMAKSEALKAFSNDDVLLEQWITNPRHIEMQIFSDHHGNHLHFFERECSIQRRYQKIIEEAPCSHLSNKQRSYLQNIAIKITSGINYKGAGTLEFLMDDQGDFYFLEMNTRLQVEHPVTEMITGFDLVYLQLLTAQGEKIPFTQKDIHMRGHAIEARICAEDPWNNFSPDIGILKKINAPNYLPYFRFDFSLNEGQEVSMYFDPMIGKVICFGMNREDAINKLQIALKECTFHGISTNKNFILNILQHPFFRKHETYTHFIPTHHADLFSHELNDEDLAKLVAISMICKNGNQRKQGDQNEKDHSSSFQCTHDIWDNISGRGELFS